MRGYRFWELVPKTELKLLHQFPLVRENQNATTVDQSITIEIGHQFGHDDRFSKARGQHDLGPPHIK